jgi:hypothetical protein
VTLKVWCWVCFVSKEEERRRTKDASLFNLSVVVEKKINLLLPLLLVGKNKSTWHLAPDNFLLFYYQEY